MSNFSSREIKDYDSKEVRVRVLRFLEDNKNTYADYPENKVFLIDREDLAGFNYLTNTLWKKCVFSSAFSSCATLIFILLSKNPQRRFHLIPPGFIVPSIVALGYHYNKINQFVDYAEAKYKYRGLYDEDLWEYHKKNALKV